MISHEPFIEWVKRIDILQYITKTTMSNAIAVEINLRSSLFETLVKEETALTQIKTAPEILALFLFC
jgi:hypothetical protein